jgi:hypothetical protein
MIPLLLLLTLQPGRDFATLNVCQLVPGEAIARALGGKLVEARPVPDKSVPRCRYFVLPAGSDSQRGYVVWMQQPQDFEELKKSISDPITVVSGLGDGAYLFRDKGDGRFKIHVLKRGDLMFEATGDSAESARKVADAVVGQLWKKAP